MARSPRVTSRVPGSILGRTLPRPVLVLELVESKRDLVCSQGYFVRLHVWFTPWAVLAAVCGNCSLEGITASPEMLLRVVSSSSDRGGRPAAKSRARLRRSIKSSCAQTSRAA
ncbi:hypothetical protein PIB30_076303 [Stylosanthes scabra]|uniref:Uncharacterized protein n=1 Tax=Stylosanthes scabra TaxID=79078 RepID=A0ABU6ZNU8_9FABA|nr:hypothetical protein [Stylosanthes scabra]